MCSLNAYEYDGWEVYPQNLSLAPLEVDPARSNRRISQLSKELFVAHHESTFEYAHLGAPASDGCRDVTFEPVKTTEKLNAVTGITNTTSIFAINQSYTWSRLCISEEHFRRLFTRLEVHPSFLDVVRLFSEKIGPVEEGFSSFFADIAPESVHSYPTASSENCSYYIGYNIKYVAKHGRSFPKDPFSIREVGVYQHFSSSTQRCNWVFLQASDQLKGRLSRAFRSCDDTKPVQQFLLHSMILLDLSEDWREYLSYLEEEFSKLVDRGFFTNVRGPQFEGDVVADFSDLRKLHILTDKLRRLVHILKLNIRTGSQLNTEMSRISTASSPALHACFASIKVKLDRFLLGQATSVDRIETLIARSSGIGQLVQSIQDIRTTEAGKQTNLEMQRLTEQGVAENKLMKRLTEQSTRDTSSMMTIALISAIFLPATFLATLFGSNFFAYSENNNTLTVASNFWVYIIITAAFSGGAVLLWLVWRQRKLRRHKPDGMEVP